MSSLPAPTSSRNVMVAKAFSAMCIGHVGPSGRNAHKTVGLNLGGAGNAERIQPVNQLIHKTAGGKRVLRHEFTSIGSRSCFSLPVETLESTHPCIWGHGIESALRNACSIISADCK